eukprot:TRINITY_DN483_c0_g3_i1.p1 TRINITY_DN483_c0_g3~~TRINITY_DN483_c0_g3_i1.p1  ORF type:complete len:681 (+),score=179.00 TRINITY_DN483_c0_g3_i1:90-2045(+)
MERHHSVVRRRIDFSEHLRRERSKRPDVLSAGHLLGSCLARETHATWKWKRCSFEKAWMERMVAGEESVLPSSLAPSSSMDVSFSNLPLCLGWSQCSGGTGLRVVCGDEAGDISIFSVADGAGTQSVKMLRQHVQHDDAVYDVSFSPDDRHIYTASADRRICARNTERGTIDVDLRGHSGSVKSISLSSSSPWLIASGGRDGKICIWDTRMKQDAPTQILPGAHVRGCVSTPRRVSTRTRSTRLPAPQPQHSVTAVLFDMDDRFLFSGGAVDRMIKIWDLRACGRKKGECTPVDVLPLRDDGKTHGVTSLKLSSCGTTLMCAMTGDLVSTYHINGRQWEKQSPCNLFGASIDSFYIRADMHTDLNMIASGSATGDVCLWCPDWNGTDVQAGDQRGKQQKESWSLPINRSCRHLSGHMAESTHVAFSPTHPFLLASVSDDLTLRIWDLQRNGSAFSACSCTAFGSCRQLHPSSLSLPLSLSLPSPPPSQSSQLSHTMLHREEEEEEEDERIAVRSRIPRRSDLPWSDPDWQVSWHDPTTSEKDYASDVESITSMCAPRALHLAHLGDEDNINASEGMQKPMHLQHNVTFADDMCEDGEEKNDEDEEDDDDDRGTCEKKEDFAIYGALSMTSNRRKRQEEIQKEMREKRRRLS